MKISTEKEAMKMVRQDGYALQSVPEAQRTEEMCLVAVTQAGGTLKSVPEALRTMEMCRVAVRQDERALESVPKALLEEIKNILKGEKNDNGYNA